MTNEENSFLKALNEHDYQSPVVGDIRKGIVVAITQQGVIVDLGLKRDGIVPSSDVSKLSDEEREALQVNDEVPVYIVNTEAPDSLIVSIHLAQLNQDWIEAEALMESGDIIEGEVIGYNKGGAIVPYGRLRGFIPASHLSELSRGMNDRMRQQKLAKLRGKKLPLKVIEVDRRRRRLVFSQRDAQKEWEEQRKEELLEKLQPGDVLSGTVSGLRDFGIFVDLGGADGLVHISELAWHRIDHPREVIKVGDEIDVYVLKVDRNDQRISLSRKQLLENPWSTVEQRYDINQLVEGTVTRIVDYGAFAEIEPGIEGLLHVSQLSRTNVDNAGDVVDVGETHLLRVVSIDQDRQRIGLSLKAVTAHEQIEWMARKELEAELSAKKSDEAPKEETDGEDTAQEVAETVAEPENQAPEEIEETTKPDSEEAADTTVPEEEVEEADATTSEEVEETTEPDSEEATEQETAEEIEQAEATDDATESSEEK
ncbi:MAG: S1 RNA-binding domain-containing protein [Anaerolineales bacterium]|nr:S1 RNA-binding domain-containing protein [Anaerolineales bacterium]